MKRVFLILVFLALSVTSVMAEEELISEHMEWAVDNGIVIGTEDGSLAPNEVVTRAQLAAMLTRFSEPEPGGQPGSYADVGADDWFYPYVSVMSSSGIMIGDGTYWRPGDEVTREEAVTSVVRIIGASEGSGSPDNASFADGGEISGWAEEYVDSAANIGIISYADIYFRPKDHVTRDELALMLYNGRRYAGYDDLSPMIDDDGLSWTPIY